MSAPADALRPEAAPSPLDRPLAWPRDGWLALAWVVVLAAAVALRFSKLNLWALSPEEARRAFAAWLLYTGAPTPADVASPAAAPLPELLGSLAFFLFGVTDATFRLPDALAGVGIVALPLLLRPWAGRLGAVGMALLAALSPTLLYASRTGNGEILAAFLALALVVALFRLGEAGVDRAALPRRIALLGSLLAALLATGPAAFHLLLALGVGAGIATVADRDGPVSRALGRLPGRLTPLVVAFVVTLVLLLTRFFAEPGGLADVGSLVAGWWSLLTSDVLGLPPVFVPLALLLYEPLALLLAAVAALRGGTSVPSERSLSLLLGGWFVAALLLWSFSAGTGPEHAVHVALPLALLAGITLGRLVGALDWQNVWRGRGGLLILAVLGLFVAAVAVLSLLGRVDGPLGFQSGALPATVVAVLVLVPLAYAVWRMAADERQAGRTGEPARLALLTVVLLLGAYELRSAILLSFDRAGEGTELLAQEATTGAVRPAVDALGRLARDAGVSDGSVRDTTGGHGLSVAIDEEVAWPWRWYLREFPEAAVVPAGTAPTAGAEVVVAAEAAPAEAAGYEVREVPMLTGTQAAAASPDLGDLLRRAVSPGEWIANGRFLLFREGLAATEAQSVALGLGPELAARAAPAAAGPFSLTQWPGPGDAPGQFDRPIGVAADAAGTVYVVDGGNGRVQRFAADGSFVGAWGDTGTGLELARASAGLGPTGIAVGDDGLAWVADTWNHRVVALDPGGEVVVELGGGEATDLGDDAAAVEEEPGRFFGPRSVALAGGEVFVADTGNERIQVFGADGRFRRAFGGYGSEPDRLIEPVGLAVGPDGNLYVADSGNARVSVFTPAGEPVRQFSVAAWPAPDPSGARPAYQPYLAFDGTGRLYASSSTSGTVEVLTLDGTALESFSGAGNEPFEQPIGVAVGPNEELLVSDYGRSAVLRLPLPPPPAEVPTAVAPSGSADEAAPTSRTVPAPPG